MLMTARKYSKTLPPQAFQSDNLAGLSRIYDDDINICVAERQPAPELAGFTAAFLSRTKRCQFSETDRAL